MREDPSKPYRPGTGRRGFVGLRLADHERREVEAAAAATGLRLSTWIRCVALEAARRAKQERKAA